MAEPLLDLERLVTDLRARRRLWLTLAVVGLILGLLFTVARQPPPQATARVLVAHADDQVSNLATRQVGDPATLMETDIALFETTQVAGAALQQLDLDTSPTSFLGTYSGEGLTPNVMQITAVASTYDEAVRRTQVLAETFVTSHVRRTEQTAEARSQALLDRQTELLAVSEEVSATISETIAAGAAAAPGAAEESEVAAQLDAQYNRRAGLAQQILELQIQAEVAALGAVDVAAGTRIVDGARPVGASLLRDGVTGGAVGFVLGLGGGLALAALLSVVRDRPVLRRDIAAQLGVSVIAQVPAVRRGPAGWWRRRRNARVRRRAAATVARVVGDAARSASLLEVGCPRTVAALALDVAEEIGHVRDVTVVDGLRTARLARAARRSRRSVTVVARDAAARAGPASAADRTLSLGVASLVPGAPWVDLGDLGSEAILVIRAGHATTSWLHHVARLLADVQVTPMGVVLVEPHPADHSDGALWDAAHLARRFRGSRRPQRRVVADEGTGSEAATRFEPSST